MRYTPLSSNFYRSTRARFMDAISQGGLAVFNSNDIYPISADSTMPFQQHRDIFYLCGIDQEESILVLCPSAANKAHREILFLKETNEHIAIWEGEKLTKEKAQEISGIETIYWLNQFDSIFTIWFIFMWVIGIPSFTLIFKRYIGSLICCKKVNTITKSS